MKLEVLPPIYQQWSLVAVRMGRLKISQTGQPLKRIEEIATETEVRAIKEEMLIGPGAVIEFMTTNSTTQVSQEAMASVLLSQLIVIMITLLVSRLTIDEVTAVSPLKSATQNPRSVQLSNHRT